MKIIGFGQTFRLDKMPAMGHEIRVLLDTGREVSVSTSEETVAQLVQIYSGLYSGITGEVGQKSARDLPLREVPPSQPKEEPAGIYPDHYVSASVPQEEEAPDAGQLVVSNVVQLPQARPTPPVQMDEMGYPVVRTQSLPQPKFLREDEDGQQI